MDKLKIFLLEEYDYVCENWLPVGYTRSKEFAEQWDKENNNNAYTELEEIT